MLALAFVMASGATLTDIAPRSGSSFRQTSEQVRNDGSGPRRFTIERAVSFDAEPDGYRVTMTLLKAVAKGDAGERRRFELINGPLLQRPISFHVDRTGRLTAIDDLPRIWDAFVSGVISVLPAGATGDGVRAQLSALPDSGRRAMIGDQATDLFAVQADRHVTPRHAVSLSSHAPFAATTISGHAEVVADGDTLVARTDAAGDAASPRPARLTSRIEQRINARSGLIVASVRTETTTAGSVTVFVTTNTKLVAR